MAYPPFDTSRLRFDTQPGTQAPEQPPLDARGESTSDVAAELGAALPAARDNGGATIFLCDASAFTAGVARHWNDMIEHGLVTHLALDERAALTEFGLALGDAPAGASLPAEGRLGSTAALEKAQRALADGEADGLGYGEALGRWIETNLDDERRGTCVLACAYRWGVPVTVHVTLGGMAGHAASDFDPAVVARAAHRDFLVLANSTENLEQGLVYQFGRPTAAVEAFTTTLAMARNVAAQYDRTIEDFTAARFTDDGNRAQPEAIVGNTIDSSDRANAEAGVAALAAEGRGYSVEGAPRQTIPALRQAALKSAGWDV